MVPIKKGSKFLLINVESSPIICCNHEKLFGFAEPIVYYTLAIFFMSLNSGCGCRGFFHSLSYIISKQFLTHSDCLVAKKSVIFSCAFLNNWSHIVNLSH